MNYNYLPIGTVVKLKEGTKKVMITGYNMKTPERPGKTYDYSACLFPEGILRSDVTMVCDKDQIEQIYYIGYIDKEEKEFIDLLQEK